RSADPAEGHPRRDHPADPGHPHRVPPAGAGREGAPRAGGRRAGGRRDDADAHPGGPVLRLEVSVLLLSLLLPVLLPLLLLSPRGRRVLSLTEAGRTWTPHLPFGRLSLVDR